jgi:hypothetical protein
MTLSDGPINRLVEASMGSGHNQTKISQRPKKGKKKKERKMHHKHYIAQGQQCITSIS